MILNKYKLIKISFLLVVINFTNVNAQSLAADGEFDNNIIGWHCGSVSPAWISDDGSPVSGNGSLQHTVENIISGTGDLEGGACDWTLVEPQKLYEFKGFYKVLTNSNFANLRMLLYWYAQDESYISVDEYTTSLDTITKDKWISFLKLVTSPPGAQKLIINMGFGFGSGTTVEFGYVRWDDLYFNEYKSIFVDGFE